MSFRKKTSKVSNLSKRSNSFHFDKLEDQNIFTQIMGMNNSATFYKNYFKLLAVRLP